MPGWPVLEAVTGYSQQATSPPPQVPLLPGLGKQHPSAAQRSGCPLWANWARFQFHPAADYFFHLQSREAIVAYFSQSQGCQKARKGEFFESRKTDNLQSRGQFENQD